jgi:5,10-methylenetetrahydrofolate reductase
VQTVELWPPSWPVEGPSSSLDNQFSWLSERLEILGKYFDAFHVADLKNPRRRYMDSVITSLQLKQKQPWLEIMPTLTVRDRNKKSFYGVVASILNSGIDNLILVWGDPFTGKEQAYSSNAYDMRSVSESIRAARDVQKQFDSVNLCILSPLDLTKIRQPNYLEKVKERERSGSDVFLSQTFFGAPETYIEAIDTVRSEGIRSPILHNVFPFFGYDDALDISKRFQLPVSKELLDRLRAGGAAEGLRIASGFREALHANRGKVNGVYVSSRGEPELAIRVVQ